MSPLARPVQDLNWLITNFVERVASVAHAIVVSADGLPMAFSNGFPPDRVDQLAAVTSGLTSLTQGAARVFEGGPVSQTVVEMERGLLLVMKRGRVISFDAPAKKAVSVFLTTAAVRGDRRAKYAFDKFPYEVFVEK